MSGFLPAATDHYNDTERRGKDLRVGSMKRHDIANGSLLYSPYPLGAIGDSRPTPRLFLTSGAISEGGNRVVQDPDVSRAAGFYVKKDNDFYVRDTI